MLSKFFSRIFLCTFVEVFGSFHRGLFNKSASLFEDNRESGVIPEQYPLL